MPSVSVSNLELFRMWRDSEELDLEWLLRRLRGEEPQTEAMKAGEALHKVLEATEPGETPYVECGEYKFRFTCDCAVALPVARELPFTKQYGDLTVRGRVDATDGFSVTDYKTTGSLDADRLLEGFQWRYYLDMTGCEVFRWIVFVMSEQFHKEYEIWQVHELTQHRYEGLERECAKLAGDFLSFAQQLEANGMEWRRTAVLEA